MEYWDDEEEGLLRRFLDEGLTFKQISTILKKTRNAVIGKANRLGLLGEKRVTHTAPRAAAAALVVSLPEATPAREARVADGSRLPQQRQCRWPFGDPRTKDFHFCTKDRSWHSSYCEEHHRMAYQGTVSAYRRGY